LGFSSACPYALPPTFFSEIINNPEGLFPGEREIPRTFDEKRFWLIPWGLGPDTLARRMEWT
jgi:hypothetical protein